MSTPVSLQTPTAAGSLLLREYERIRFATDELVAHLSAEDMMVQSMPECSPAKWHLAHTTWFFETFILAGDQSYRLFDPRFRVVFNSYYKQLGEHPFRGDRGTFSRPSLEEVAAYREHVDRGMAALLSREVPSETTALLELGLNHEQQHQELIVTDVKHAFYSQPLRPAYVAGVPDQTRTSAPKLRFVQFDGGVVTVGHDGRLFSFDNELPRHEVLLRPFSLASRLTTNAEYLEFILDGGYRRPELWLSDGWDTVQKLGWRAPLYWEREGDSYNVFTARGMEPIEPAEPVNHVSFYEADAFARWAGARLPLETEWEHAAAKCEVKGNFAESGKFHPQPAKDSAVLQQMFGDVWEWTASPYVGYPGYKPAEGVVGEYNGKFMCNQLVLRGGSCATPQSHIRATYRNFFPPHARWQFMGIRLAKNER